MLQRQADQRKLNRYICKALVRPSISVEVEIGGIPLPKCRFITDESSYVSKAGKLHPLCIPFHHTMSQKLCVE